MEFSAASSGGRPKLCPVGESRFKGSMALCIARPGVRLELPNAPARGCH